MLWCIGGAVAEPAGEVVEGWRHTGEERELHVRVRGRISPTE
jgi:hypothetical protein